MIERFKEWMMESKFGKHSRGGTPNSLPASGQWSSDATLQPAQSTPQPPPPPKKRSKKVVVDDPEAMRIVDELLAQHKQRTQGATDPLDVQDSYDQFKQAVKDAGIVPTETGYGFK